MELNKMINPSNHKTSFDIRLPYDSQSKCNKFIIKGYSMCVCILNIIMKVVITIAISEGVMWIIFSTTMYRSCRWYASRGLKRKTALKQLLFKARWLQAASQSSQWTDLAHAPVIHTQVSTLHKGMFSQHGDQIIFLTSRHFQACLGYIWQLA